MYSTITLYPNLPLGSENYIIDDIFGYLNLYINTSITRKTQIIYPQLVQSVYLGFESDKIEELKKYNYIHVFNSDNTNYFYFIRNIEYAALNNVLFTLELDVLNTYKNQFDFAFNTFVIREHIDRWDYNGFYLNTTANKLCLLRNFVKDEDENQLTELTFSGSLYCDYINDLVLSRNYWIKFKVKDENVGIQIYFLNLNYSFNVMVSEEEAIEIKAFTQYTSEEINIIIQNNNVIMDMSIIPYPPHEAFKDVGIDDLYIDPTEFDNIFKVGYLSFKLNEKTVNMVGIFTTLYTSLLPLDKISVKLDKIADHNDKIYYINSLLYNLLVTEVLKVDKLIEHLKKHTLHLNGVFGYVDDEIMTLDKFSFVNEPSVLKNNYLNLNLSFLSFSNNLLIENLKLKDSSKFKELCENYSSITQPNPIISLNYKLYYFDNGGRFYIKDGIYFNYNSYNYDGETIRFFSILPSLSNSAIEYQKEAELKRLQDNVEEKPKSLFDEAKETAKQAADWIKKAPKKVTTSIVKGISTLVRTGSPVKAAVSAGLGFLFTKEEENNKKALSSTSYESAITGTEFKLNFIIKNCVKVRTIQDLYYFTGNLINCNKIPTHNNRILFDYLKCDPKFKKHINANIDIINKIIELFNDGVYYIHDYHNSFNFPYENYENYEVALVNRLIND